MLNSRLGEAARIRYAAGMEHKLRLLSQLGPVRVEGCSCGVVHLSVGAVSLRLSAKHATQLTQALVSASQEFEQEETISAAQLPGRSSGGGDQSPGGGGNQIH